MVPFEVLRDEFAGGVKAVGHTLLVLKWDNPIPLSRAWCVFEMGITLAMRARMEVLMPPQDKAAFLSALIGDMDSITPKICTVDVEQAQAREENDLKNIQRVIIESGGYLKTNQLVIQAMKDWMLTEGSLALAAIPAEDRGTSALIIRYLHPSVNPLRYLNPLRYSNFQSLWRYYKSPRVHWRPGGTFTPVPPLPN